MVSKSYSGKLPDEDCWIQTVSKRIVYFRDLKPEMFDIEDIAVSLSHLCRFTGHLRKFYSVAQHSVRVADLVPGHYKLAALLHDAAEAYISDINRPVKHSYCTVKVLEHSILDFIYKKYGAFADDPGYKIIKEADNIMLSTEARDLMGLDEEWIRNGWNIKEPCLPDKLEPWPSEIDYNMFMSAFERYSSLKEKYDRK